MGYLNTQLEKQAFYASTLASAGAAGGIGGALIGAQQADQKDKLAGIIGGGLGGGTGGMAGLLGAAKVLDMVDPHGANGLATLGLIAAGVLGGGGVGAYTGSELAKKLKNTPSE